MKPKELIKGTKYYYTAGQEWVKVIYMYQTINGYMFAMNGKENILTGQDVNRYIEEI